jgi:hypothetical protein
MDKIQGYKCTQCGGIEFEDCSLPKNGLLPAVRGMQCKKCNSTFWNREDSLKYQKAKKNLKTTGNKNAKKSKGFISI